MDKQTKTKIALAVLVVIMVFVWGPVMTGGGSKSPKKSNSSAGSTIVSKESNMDLIALAHSSERKKSRTSYKEWGRNPFVPVEGPKASIVEGIMWDAQEPKAIINGNIFGIGENVGSGEIIDIRPASVTIKSGTTEKIYRLGQ